MVSLVELAAEGVAFCAESFSDKNAKGCQVLLMRCMTAAQTAKLEASVKEWEYEMGEKHGSAESSFAFFCAQCRAE